MVSRSTKIESVEEIRQSFYIYPSGQNRQKLVWKSAFLLIWQCHSVKNTLLETAFSAILATGISAEWIKWELSKNSKLVKSYESFGGEI